MNTIKGNKIIAEFMGYKNGEDNYHNGMTDESGSNTFPCLVAPNGNKITHVYYNTSFDWIMPVVDKIAAMGMEPEPYDPTDITKEAAKVATIQVCCSIETVWQAVTSFIQWYNKQPKQ